MKKQLLLAAACLFALAGAAQTNLARGCTSRATSGTATLGNDGNTGTRWESDHSDSQNWQVDLGKAQEFNTVNIVWEGAYASSFTIEAGNTVGDDGYLTDGKTIATVDGQTLSGFPYTQTISVDATNARYIEFKGTKRGTNYGYSFWEFQVYNLTEALKTSSVTLTSPFASNTTTVGSTGTFTYAAKTQIGGSITPSTVSYASSNTSVGTIDSNGLFTALAAGTTDITATADGVTSAAQTVTVTAGQKIDLFTNWQYRVYPIGSTDAGSMVGAFDTNDGSLWSLTGGKTTGADEAARTYDVGFIADLGGTYDLTSASLHFEGACSKAYTLSFSADGVNFSNEVAGGTGADVANNHTETPDVSAAKGVRYVKFLSTKAATVWGVKLFDFSLVGTKTADVTDANPPKWTKAEVAGTTDNTVTLTVNAAGDASRFIAYQVSGNGINTQVFSGETYVSGTDATITLGNLSTGTTYNLSVIAFDAFGKGSEIKTVSATTMGAVFTLTAAPAPTEAAGNVISLYSDAYNAATTFNIGYWGSSTAVAEETVGTDKLYHFTNFNYLGWEFNSDIDLSGMKYLHVDVLPLSDTGLRLTPIMRGGSLTEQADKGDCGTLKTKEWNSIDIPLSNFNLDFANYKAFQLKFVGANGENAKNANLYIDNVYFWTDGAAQPALTISPSAGDHGFYKVKGTLNVDTKATLESTDKIALDLTGVTIAEGVGTINFKNPNTVVKVAGTVTDNVATPTVDLGDTRNLLVANSQGYLFPVKTYEVDDAYPVYHAFFISCGTTGWKYTRKLAAGQYATTMLPTAVETSKLADGITVYDFDKSSTATEVKFTRNRTILSGAEPHVIHNSNATEVEFTVSCIGDFNITANPASATLTSTDGKVNFCGNYIQFTADGTQYGLKASETEGVNLYNVVSPAYIGAFRAYITGVSAASAKVFFSDGTATGISGISTDGTRGDAEVYNLAGQRVNAGSLPAGIYVRNGKKFIKK